MTYHGGQNALQYATECIEYIAERPDDDEDDGQSFGAASKIFGNLGREHDDPTRDGNGACDTAESFNAEVYAL
jgi:hypothetical protein